MLRGSGNTLCPEGRQGARIEWVWRTCPPKWAKGMRKPLQDEAHSPQRVRKWERWEEASAGWAARGSGAVEMGKVRRNREGPEAATCSKMADLKWRLLLAVFREHGSSGALCGPGSGSQEQGHASGGGADREDLTGLAGGSG